MENLSMENPAFVALVHCAGTLGLNMLIKVSGSDLSFKWINDFPLPKSIKLILGTTYWFHAV